MILEDLLEADATTLEKLSDTELNALLSPYFNVTRPSVAVKLPKNVTVASLEERTKSAKAREILKQMGIDDVL